MSREPLSFPQLTPDQARLLSPLQLAFVGDAVHAMIVRTHLIAQNLKVHDMHVLATRSVNAVSQYQALQRVLPLLTEEENGLVRRGRNAHPHHGAPKAASAGEYAGATGLETLLGFLYLTGQWDRLEELSPYLYAED